MNNENKRWEHVLLVTRVSASLISLTDRWRIRNVPSNEGCSSVAAPAPHRSLIRAEYSHNICPIRDHLSGPASECDIYWSLTVSHMLACSPCDMGQWGSCGAGVPGVRALWLHDNHRDHHCLSQSTRRENINTNLHNLPYLNPHGERGDCIFISINRKVWCNEILPVLGQDSEQLTHQGPDMNHSLLSPMSA